MNHYHTRRLAVYPLLAQHGLLAANSNNNLQLARRGRALLNVLCEKLDVAIVFCPGKDAFLQDSLAKFEPYLAEDYTLGGLIYCSQDLNAAEQLFAIAHEIGHYYLHQGQATACHGEDLELEISLDDTDNLLSGQVEVYNPRNLREREANAFALELLMPSLEMRDRYQAFVQNETGELSRVERLANHFGVTNYRVLMQLANTFLAAPLRYALSDPAAPENPTQNLSEPVKLDDEQAAAATTPTPALVLAGPGSGKTRTLVERIRYLVEKQNIPPAQLLVLTFSNKAAAELRERLTLAGVATERMNVATFHAFGVDFLRRYAERAGLPRDFRLLDSARAYLFMEEILARFPDGYYVNPYNPTGYLLDLLTDFSRAKDYLRTPDDYDRAVERMATDPKPYKPEEISKAGERAAIYRIYEAEKRTRGLVDFSDLIMLPVQLMQQDPAVLATERARYAQVLVDEFQDINYASGQFLELLCSPAHGGAGNIWAVGDLNQSIYRFRGAFPRQAGGAAFSSAFGEANVLELSNNYRSLSPVVAVANHLRDNMPPEGATLPLQAVRGAGNTPEAAKLFYRRFDFARQELSSLAAQIRQKHADGYAYSDQAILCQRHVHADAFARHLTAAGIPVSRLGPFFNRPEIQETLALLTLLDGNESLALLRLAHGNAAFGAATILKLARRYRLQIRRALNDTRVRESLDEKSRAAVEHLSVGLSRLENRRSIWYLLAQFLFDYSFGFAELVRQTTDETAPDYFSQRQKMRALGQKLRLAAMFDRESEAEIFRAEERRLGRELTFEEKKDVRQAKIQPAGQRRAYTRFIYALVQSDARVELGDDTPIGLSDATNATATPGRVHIITAHASKGLEFPVVYLPGLAQTGTPPWDAVLPAPPDFHLVDLTPGGEGQQEDRRCLFYVSVTRARDELYLTYAESDKEPDAPETDGDDEADAAPQKIKKRPPMPELTAALEHRESYAGLWSTLPLVEAENATHAPSGTPPVTIELLPRGQGIDYHKLRRYEQCPRRYYYQYVLPEQLPDVPLPPETDTTENEPGETVKSGKLNTERSKFYDGLLAAHRELHEKQLATGQLPELVALLDVYDQKWSPPAPKTESPPAETENSVEITAPEIENQPIETVASEPETKPEKAKTTDDASYYRERGKQVVEQLWQQQKNVTNATAKSIRVEFDVYQSVHLQDVTVGFRVERIEYFADGSKKLVHTRTKALPKDEKGLDSDSEKPYRLLALYALANPHRPGAEPNEIVLEAVSPTGITQMSVPKAYKKADAYLKHQSGKAKAPGIVGNFDKLATSLRAAKFEPERGEHCLRCRFYTLVCPDVPLERG